MARAMSTRAYHVARLSRLRYSNLWSTMCQLHCDRAATQPETQGLHTGFWVTKALRSPVSYNSVSTSDGVHNQPQAMHRSRMVRFLSTAMLLVVSGGIGFTMGAAPAVETVSGLMNPPKDADTLHLYKPENPQAEAINRQILQHPLALSLRHKSGTFVESRPHMKIPINMRPHNFTGGTLFGSDMIEVPAVLFVDSTCELPTVTSIVHLGPALCADTGHVHGGVLATILDEGLARTCFPALPNKVGVTASLNVDYIKSCPQNSYVVMIAETTKVEGRKAWVRGQIEMLGDNEQSSPDRVLVKADALFVEPRGAKNMARIYSPS